MGIAEVIPGVSGGTIALITGIYERLLNALAAYSMSSPRILCAMASAHFIGPTIYRSWPRSRLA